MLIDLFDDFFQLHWLQCVEYEFRIWKCDENCSGLFQGMETNPRICLAKLRKTTKSLVGILNSSGQSEYKGGGRMISSQRYWAWRECAVIIDHKIKLTA